METKWPACVIYKVGYESYQREPVSFRIEKIEVFWIGGSYMFQTRCRKFASMCRKIFIFYTVKDTGALGAGSGGRVAGRCAATLNNNITMRERTGIFHGTGYIVSYLSDHFLKIITGGKIIEGTYVWTGKRKLLGQVGHHRTRRMCFWSDIIIRVF